MVTQTTRKFLALASFCATAPKGVQALMLKRNGGFPKSTRTKSPRSPPTTPPTTPRNSGSRQSSARSTRSTRSTSPAPETTKPGEKTELDLSEIRFSQNGISPTFSAFGKEEPKSLESLINKLMGACQPSTKPDEMVVDPEEIRSIIPPIKVVKIPTDEQKIEGCVPENLRDSLNGYINADDRRKGYLYISVDNRRLFCMKQAHLYLEPGKYVGKGANAVKVPVELATSPLQVKEWLSEHGQKLDSENGGTKVEVRGDSVICVGGCERFLSAKLESKVGFWYEQGGRMCENCGAGQMDGAAAAAAGAAAADDDDLLRMESM